MPALSDLSIRVENAQHFARLVDTDPDFWCHCMGELHKYAVTQATREAQLRGELFRLREQSDNKTLDVVAVRTRNAELERDLGIMRSARDELAGVTKYQDARISKCNEEIIQLRRQVRDGPRPAADPAVNTLISISLLLSCSLNPIFQLSRQQQRYRRLLSRSSASSRLSERLPNPAIFDKDGNLEDLRRFQAKQRSIRR